MPDDPPPDDALDLGRLAASQLGGDWQLDIPDDLPPPDGEEPTPTETQGLHPPLAAATEETGNLRPTLGLPPSPEQLVEAMLFVGGPPLAAEVACGAVRGLTADRFQQAVATLNKRYRDQRRPYTIEAREGGFALAVRAQFRGLREKLFGGPREARLGQPALDVLSVVAYRQPVGKAEVDAVRGTDSGTPLRQLVRLGLIAVQHRADATGREVRYGTTFRFLTVFGLSSLDELPRLGDSSPV
ncbi:MAG: SMC-Scp complex subunit ScpB [Gemmataceae bacterium]|nr:SMC-Scp complex subunit ScpB [Gemmataceae bacterium]